jgi:hypothetical protein
VIEPNQTRSGEPLQVELDENTSSDFVLKRPLRCMLANRGYCIPDPDVANRLSIWFSGGSLEPCDKGDLDDWNQLFDGKQVPRRDMMEYARVLAAKVLLGAHVTDVVEDDGMLSYQLKRPIGGHGQVFCDILYSDEDFRIVRGHRGSILCFSKVPMNFTIS